MRGGVSAVLQEYVQSEALAETVCFCWVPTSSGHSRGRNLWMAVIGFCRFVGLISRIDIVHVHTSWVRSFWRKVPFIVVALVARKKVAIQFHTSHVDYLAMPLFGRIAKKLTSRADAIVALSSRCARPLADLGFPVRLLGNPATALGDSTTAGMAILYMGRLCAEKGIYDLIWAFRGVLSDVPQAELWIGGAGDDIAAECSKAGVTHAVRNLGWLSGSRKAEAYVNAAVFCLPSYDEALPMSVLEAMACGLPTVTTDAGGLADEVRQGVTGFVVRPGDVPGLTAALTALLKDEALRVAYGNAGRERVSSRYSPEVVFAELAGMYYKLNRGAGEAQQVSDAIEH